MVLVEHVPSVLLPAHPDRVHGRQLTSLESNCFYCLQRYNPFKTKNVYPPQFQVAVPKR